MLFHCSCLVSFFLLSLCFFSTVFVQAEVFELSYDIPSSEDSIFVVPNGVFSLLFTVEGHTPVGSTHEAFAATGRLAVAPNEVYYLHVGDVATDCADAGEASYVTRAVDGSVVLLGAGASLDNNGSTFTSMNLDGGEGYDQTCGGLSYYHDYVINPQEVARTGTAGVSLRWNADCSEQYDALHSDYDPDLLATSSLYIRDSVALLELHVALPIYYYDVTFDYLSQCNGVQPDVTVETVGCMNYFYTSVEYVENCPGFEYAVDPNNEEIDIFQGTMRVNASASLSLSSSWDVERDLSAPINWQVQLQRIISVYSDVEIVNGGVCITDADCNGEGCCENEQCNCLCPALANGYTGTNCNIDNTNPVCANIPNDIVVTSPRGGCVANLIHKLPNITDNSGVLVQYERIYNDAQEPTLNFLEGAVDDLADLCFSVGQHNFTYQAADASNNEAVCSFTVEVLDGAAPELDCAGCQGDTPAGKMFICIGTNDIEEPFEKVAIDYSELETYMSLHNVPDGDFLPQVPGRMINMSYDYGTGHGVSTDPEHRNVYLKCNCTLEVEDPDAPLTAAERHGMITNSWGIWGTPRAFDAQDFQLVPVLPANHYDPVPNTSDFYTVTYEATDTSGNTGSCDMLITYDIDPPTCDGWTLTVRPDPWNRNYTMTIKYPEIPWGMDVDIAGFKNVSLYPPREQDDTYFIGNAECANFTSSYTIYDLAGNEGTCKWDLLIENFDNNTCVWPECDNPPHIVGQSCPCSKIELCRNIAHCDGCVSWVEPTFFDDLGIVEATQSHHPGDIFELGKTRVTYTVRDRLDQVATCIFDITVRDRKPPVWDCPDDYEVFTGNATEKTIVYDVAAEDACPRNLWVAYDTATAPLPTEVNLGVDEEPEGAETLGVGSHQLSFEAADSSGNKATCAWTVTVTDDFPPTIECPDDVYVRIPDPDRLSWVLNFEEKSIWDNIPGVYATWSHNPGFAFPANTTTIVTGTAHDLAGNTAQCTFNVEIVEGFPYPQVDAVLTKSVVRELSPGVFGADLEMITRTARYNRLFNFTSITDAILADPVEIDADCPNSWSPCFQTWRMTVEFDACAINQVAYDFTSIGSCMPDACPHPDRLFDVRITLTAANYCWQDLADVEIFATLTTHTRAVYDSYLLDYNDGGSDPEAGSEFYPESTVFYNAQEIAGIIEVNTNQVIITNTLLKQAAKVYYSDSGYTQIITQNDLVVNDVEQTGVTIQAPTLETIATFLYFEDSVPLDETYFVRYSATVELTFDLGQGNARRRLLELEFDQNRELLQSASSSQSEESTADIMILDGPLTENLDDRDGIVLLMLNGCDNSTNSFAHSLEQPIATYLKIDENRVNVAMEVNNDDSCFVEITLEETNCDSLIDVNDLIASLRHGVGKFNSDFHTEVADFSPYHTFDRDVFFVVQQPAPDVYVAEYYSGVEMLSDGMTWTMFFAGVATGMVVMLIVVKAYLQRQQQQQQQQQQPSGKSLPQFYGLTEGETRRSSMSEQDLAAHQVIVHTTIAEEQ